MSKPGVGPLARLDQAITQALTVEPGAAQAPISLDGLDELVEMFARQEAGAADALTMALGSAIPVLRRAAWGALLAANDGLRARLATQQEQAAALDAALGAAQVTNDGRARRLAQAQLISQLETLRPQLARLDALQAELRQLGTYVERRAGAESRQR